MKINTICVNILKITDAEFAEMEEVAQGQLDYLSPLRGATMARQHRLGTYNMRVLKELRALRELLRTGDTIYNDR